MTSVSSGGTRRGSALRLLQCRPRGSVTSEGGKHFGDELSGQSKGFKGSLKGD